MKNFLQLLIVTPMMFLAVGCQTVDDKLNVSIQKSVAWLWSQQAEDGGWHSTTHDVLEDGTALTPYILYHLMKIPAEEFKRPVGGVERGLAFIRENINAALVKDNGTILRLEYPNYSAAYALRVFNMNESDTALQRLLAEHLIKEQFVEHRGITKDNLAYGGWGYGEPGLPFGTHGHVDISHTRRIIEALMDFHPPAPLQRGSHDSPPLKVVGGMSTRTSHSLTPPPLKGAGGLFTLTSQTTHFSQSHFLTVLLSVNVFLQGVQRTPEDPRLYEGCLSRKNLPYDGGFISSTVTMYTNKSSPVEIVGSGIHYPSYATATCDGLLAMHALGMQNTKAYADAKDWLQKHQDMSTVEGLSPEEPEQWHRVMHYYHLAVRAEAMTVAGIKGSWSNELTQLLISEQTPEGYYINPIGGVNKEDDPLMATIFAVQAGWELNKE